MWNGADQTNLTCTNATPGGDGLPLTYMLAEFPSLGFLSLSQHGLLPVHFPLNMSLPCCLIYTGSLFHTLRLTFEALHNLSPPYLTALLQTYTASRSLRSSSAGLLALPAIKLSTVGARAFSHAALKLWNSLSPYFHLLDYITQSKTALKTHLFKINSHASTALCFTTADFNEY